MRGFVEEYQTMQLEQIRRRPGFRFREVGHRSVYMVLHLCAGMVRDGDASGGHETVAVVSLQTGSTMFMQASSVIEPAN